MGETETCECSDGATGTRTCGADGFFTVCSCTPPIDDLEFAPLDGPRFDTFSVGSDHTCGLDDQGSPTCFGKADQGRLDGDFESAGISPLFETITAGGRHTCGLLIESPSDTNVICWGANDFGQLATSRVDRLEIARFDVESVPDPLPLADIAAGEEHMVGLDAAGDIYAWGQNTSRQSKPGNDADLNEPERAITPISLANQADGTFVAISAGGRHSCALDSSAGIVCWGSNSDGQRVLPPCETATGVCNEPGNPKLHFVDGPFAEVVAGGRHTCIREEETNAVRCWGAGELGQTGVGVVEDTGTDLPTGTLPEATQPSLPEGLSAAAFGRSIGDTQCVVGTEGEVVCWGENGAGQASPARPDLAVVEPTRIELPAKALAVASGRSHTCALLEGGFLRCWGSDDDGQIGAFNLYETR